MSLSLYAAKAREVDTGSYRLTITDDGKLILTNGVNTVVVFDPSAPEPDPSAEFGPTTVYPYPSLNGGNAPDHSP